MMAKPLTLTGGKMCAAFDFWPAAGFANTEADTEDQRARWQRTHENGSDRVG